MGEIKQLTIEDAPALQEISIETYTDTFDHIIPQKICKPI